MFGFIILFVVVFGFIGLIYWNSHTKYEIEEEPTNETDIKKIDVPDNNVEIRPLEEVVEDIEEELNENNKD